MYRDGVPVKTEIKENPCTFLVELQTLNVFWGIILNNVSLFYIFQVLEGEDLAKGNWQQFLKRNQEVGLDTVGFAVVEEVLMEASALTMAVLTGLRREQTLRSTQATARRAGPPFCNT